MTRSSLLSSCTLATVLLLCAPTSGQQLTGTLLDASSRQPVPFAYVYIGGTDTGTMSDSLGHYVLRTEGLPAGLADSLQVQRIGYDRLSMPFSRLRGDSDTLLLCPLATLLEEVSLTSTGFSERVTLGHPGIKSRKFVAGWSGIQDRGSSSYFALSEIGTTVKVRPQTDHLLKSVRVNLAANTFDSVLLRINLYALEEGLPADRLVHREITTTAAGHAEKEYAEADLSAYHITVNEDFAVTIEWLDAWEGPASRRDDAQLLLSAQPLGGQLLVQRSPDAPWLPGKHWKLGVSLIALR